MYTQCIKSTVIGGDISTISLTGNTSVLDEQIRCMLETQMQDTNERTATLSYWKLSGQKAGQSGL